MRISASLPVNTGVVFGSKRYRSNYDLQFLRPGDTAVLVTERRDNPDVAPTYKFDMVRVDAVEGHKGRRVGGFKVPFWGVPEDRDSVDYLRVTDLDKTNPRAFLMGSYVKQVGLAYRRTMRSTVMHARDTKGQPLTIDFKEDDPFYRKHLSGENAIPVHAAKPAQRQMIWRWEDFVENEGKFLRMQRQAQAARDWVLRN